MHRVLVDTVEQPGERHTDDKRAAGNPIQAEESNGREHRKQRVAAAP